MNSMSEEAVCRDDGLHLLTLLNVVTDSHCMPLSFAIFYSMNYRGRYMWDTCKKSELRYFPLFSN